MIIGLIFNVAEAEMLISFFLSKFGWKNHQEKNVGVSDSVCRIILVRDQSRLAVVFVLFGDNDDDDGSKPNSCVNNPRKVTISISSQFRETLHWNTICH